MGRPRVKRNQSAQLSNLFSAAVIFVLAAASYFYALPNEHEDAKERGTIITYDGGFPYGMVAPKDPAVTEILRIIGDRTLKGHVPEADYMQGLLAIEEALVAEPTDINLHLHRAQMLFELESFKDSSQSIANAMKYAATPDHTSQIMQRTLVYPPVSIPAAYSVVLWVNSVVLRYTGAKLHGERVWDKSAHHWHGSGQPVCHH
jgi:hypothetical protein